MTVNYCYECALPYKWCNCSRQEKRENRDPEAIYNYTMTGLLSNQAAKGKVRKGSDVQQTLDAYRQYFGDID